MRRREGRQAFRKGCRGRRVQLCEFTEPRWASRNRLIMERRGPSRHPAARSSTPSASPPAPWRPWRGGGHPAIGQGARGAARSRMELCERGEDGEHATLPEASTMAGSWARWGTAARCVCDRRWVGLQVRTPPPRRVRWRRRWVSQPPPGGAVVGRHRSSVFGRGAPRGWRCEPGRQKSTRLAGDRLPAPSVAVIAGESQPRREVEQPGSVGVCRIASPRPE